MCARNVKVFRVFARLNMKLVFVEAAAAAVELVVAAAPTYSRKSSLSLKRFIQVSARY